MKRFALLAVPALLFLIVFVSCAPSQKPKRVGNQFRRLLQKGWVIQDSARVAAGGEMISTAAFKPNDWLPASVPSTVMAALVADGVYKNIYYGMNLAEIPTQQFQHPWWFRKAFQLSEEKKDEKIWLRFNGIVYRANVWLNGKKIVSADTMAGAFRRWEFDVTDAVRKKGENVLAVEVYPPKPGDLSIGFVDWNPPAPDKNLGIWQAVELRFSAPVKLRHPYVITKLNLPKLDQAKLTITAEAANSSGNPVTGTAEIRIGDLTVAQTVKLAAGEVREIVFDPAKFKALIFRNPRLWWPNLAGPQNMYDLQFTFLINGEVSDRISTRFGIREVGSYFDKKGYRVFTVNGKPILIRGGGWTDDLLLADTPRTLRAKVGYAKAMNLNTIRLEGVWGTDDLYRLCDENGLLVWVGWSCQWEWENLIGTASDEFGGIQTPLQMDLAVRSWKDQILRLRNHPSILVWLYGSDKPPRPALEKRYLEVLKRYDPNRPFLSSAAGKPTEVTGPTGVKMNGPYAWVPPVYWYADSTRGGHFGFNTETGPGAEVPPLESVKKMIPPAHLWPIDDVWNFHGGRGNFKNFHFYTKAISERYGAPVDVQDFCKKAQVINYEGIRAMFEAFGQNKFTATGVIQWMLNSAWPSMLWQLYDYYLMPGGAFFGAKKACEPLHIQYDYGDRSIYLVNGFYSAFDNLLVRVRVFNENLHEKFEQEMPVSVGENESKFVLKLPEISGLSQTYFLDLRLADKKGKEIGSNFYWLSTKPDILDEKNANWFVTPTESYGNLKDLQNLPAVRLVVQSKFEKKGENQIARVTVKNPTDKLAFFVHVTVEKGSTGASVLPVYWDDNYFPLLPGEVKKISARFAAADLDGQEPVVKVTGWNVE